MHGLLEQTGEARLNHESPVKLHSEWPVWQMNMKRGQCSGDIRVCSISKYFPEQLEVHT